MSPWDLEALGLAAVTLITVAVSLLAIASACVVLFRARKGRGQARTDRHWRA
jgi:hypothetical protein